MLNKLSTQERVLIIALLTIVIWAVGIMFVIKPNIEKNSDMKTKLETAEQAKMDVDNKIASEPLIKENISNSKATLSKILEPFFPATANYDIDQYITRIWENNGLKPSSITIADPSVSTLDYYSYESVPLSYPLGDYAKSKKSGTSVGALVDTENSENAEDTTQVNESCEIASTSNALVGSYNQVINFINAVSHDPKTLLITDIAANVDPANGSWNATVGIDFIAVDKYDQ